MSSPREQNTTPKQRLENIIDKLQAYEAVLKATLKKPRKNEESLDTYTYGDPFYTDDNVKDDLESQLKEVSACMDLVRQYHKQPSSELLLSVHDHLLELQRHFDVALSVAGVNNAPIKTIAILLALTEGESYQRLKVATVEALTLIAQTDKPLYVALRAAQKIDSLDTAHENIQNNLIDEIKKIALRTDLDNDKKYYYMFKLIFKGYELVDRETKGFHQSRLGSELLQMIMPSAHPNPELIPILKIADKYAEEMKKTLQPILNDQAYWKSQGNPDGVDRMRKKMGDEKVPLITRITKAINIAHKCQESEGKGGLFKAPRTPETSAFYKAMSEGSITGLETVKDKMNKPSQVEEQKRDQELK